MKKPIPWGRGIALALATLAFSVAVPSAVQWRQMRSKCADAETTTLAVLPDAFGASGVVEAAFSPKYSFICKEVLVVETDSPNHSLDDVRAIVKGVQAQLAIIGPNGNAVFEEEVTDERFRPHWPRRGTNGVFPAIGFNPVRPGDYRLRLTILHPASPLVAVPHRVVARYELCGIEYLATLFAGGIALLTGLVGLALTAGVVLVTRNKQQVWSHAQSSTVGHDDCT